jgi:ribosome-binding ATPase
MQVTIVGLPGSGKTTVFNALTGGHAQTGGYTAGHAAPNVGVVKVPDDRLDRLSALFHPKKTTPADVTYVDVAIAAGAAREGTIAPDVLAQIRNADALLHVARAFEGAAERPPDPWRDVDELDLEFTVADLAVIEKRLEKLRTSGRHGSPAEREQNAAEEELFARLEPGLAEGTPLRSVALTDDEELRLRGYRFLTQKPVLVLLNVDDGQLPAAERLEAEGRARYAQPQTDVAVLGAQIEAEIEQLPEADRRAFMTELGITEPGRGRIIRLTYGLLGLISFLTVGEDECRAWTLRQGATAVDAAAAIHSDLARGFIRAEVINWEDLLRAGSEAAAKKQALMRTEGREYTVKDGDVIRVLFNVAR